MAARASGGSEARAAAPLRVAVPAALGEEQLAAVRAASPRASPARLEVTWHPGLARLARSGARRILPYPAYRSLRVALEGAGRHALRLDGLSGGSFPGVEALFASWALSRSALRIAIDALPDLRWIHSSSTGVDRFDLPLLEARAIALTAPAGVHARRIAEHVLACACADAKGLLLRRGPAARRPDGPRELRDLVLGIVGYGAIGREVARLARANGLAVLALTRGKGSAPEVEGVELSHDLGGVLSGSDVLVLALPLTASTRGLVGRRELALMRRDALLVNVGRAGTVVEGDLLAALRRGTIRGACLDLLDDEGDDVPRSHPALRIPNLLYTGHRAATSSRAGEEVLASFVENLRRYAEGEPLLGRIETRTSP